MITQFTLNKKVSGIVQETLTVLYNCIAKLGCGMIGYDLELEDGRVTKSR